MSTPGQGSILGSSIIYGNVDFGPTFGKVYRPVSQQSIQTAAGDYTVQPFDMMLIFRKVVAASFAVLLPDLDLWMRLPYGGFPLTIKDGSYNSSGFPITLTPFGAQKIDTLSSWQIAQDGQMVILLPLTDRSGWTII